MRQPRFEPRNFGSKSQSGLAIDRFVAERDRSGNRLCFVLGAALQDRAPNFAALLHADFDQEG